MAHVEEGGKGRSANTDVNIVPFIDLMSVLVIFLLISAVWTQVTMIQIGSSVYGKKTSDTPPKLDSEVHVPLRLDIRSTGHHVVLGSEKKMIHKVDGEYNIPALLNELSLFKKVHPTKVDAVVTIEDELKYEYLIMGMDALLTAEFPKIAVSTAAAL